MKQPSLDLEPEVVKPRCQVPPPGWWCSRTAGHAGPCAARPISTRVEPAPCAWSGCVAQATKDSYCPAHQPTAIVARIRGILNRRLTDLPETLIILHSDIDSTL
jgi:hypothetical protein